MPDEMSPSGQRHLSNTETECQFCQQEFSRPEHLKRHMHIHTQEKPFACPICGKKFSRKDVAKRHESAHSQVEPEAANYGSRNAVVCHACTECRRMQVRCSGQEPCQNCEKNSTGCQYVPRKRKRKRTQQRVPDAQTSPSGPPMAECAPSLGEDEGRRFSQQEAVEDHSLNPCEAISVDFGSNKLPVDNPHCWALETIDAPHQPQSRDLRSSGDATIVDQELLPRFTDEAQVWWNETATSNDRNGFTGPRLDTTAIDGNMLDAFGSWVNWLPFDGANYLQFDSTTTELPHVTIPSQIQGTQGLQARQDPNAQSYKRRYTSAQIPERLSPSTQISQLSQTSKNSMRHPLRRPSQVHSTRGLYVAGTGARSTRIDGAKGRNRISRTITASSTDRSPLSSSHSGTSLHESIDEYAMLASKEDIPTIISQQNLDEILSRIEPTFTNHAFVLHPFSINQFPSLTAMNYLVHLYIENFQPVYPFLDLSMRGVSGWCWSTTLATAAIGARYMPSSVADASSEALHGLLHMMLVQEYDVNSNEESLVYIQARALNAIGLCYCRQKTLMNIGFKIADTVFAAASRLSLLDEITDSNHDSPESDSASQWIYWRTEESRRRTGFFVWMLDCTLAYASNTAPRLSLSPLKLLLPSMEELFEAPTFEAWQSLITENSGQMRDLPWSLANRSAEPVSLQELLWSLYIEKRIIRPVSDFAKMMLVHAIIHRTWDVAKFYGDPLSLWDPTAPNLENPLPRPLSRYKYIATIPQFSNWRNSACDCLDLLHWESLGMSAQAGGLESPVFLTLHLARTVLLAPGKELEGLAQAIIDQPHSSLLPHERLPLHLSFEECQEIVQIWARRDRYKARLAVLHGASTYWHVRRNASGSFVQPFAVFVATIILWAYGTYALQEKADQEVSATEQNFDHQSRSESSRKKNDTDAIEQAVDDDELSSSPSLVSSPGMTPYNPRLPSFMHIDRPFDDEIAQHFIRSGEHMKVFLEGVGDLCSGNGPKLVLREGAQILRRISMWSIAENYATRLESLALKIG